MEQKQIKIDKDKLKRKKPVDDPQDKGEEPTPVSAGAIDKVIDYAFNPSREKIREMTIIDRLQARLLPQLDLVNLQWQHTIEVATYRQDSIEYAVIYKQKQPKPPNLIDEYMYRVAQWQKSRDGTNLNKAIDIALAETEAKAGEDDFGDKADNYYKE